MASFYAEYGKMVGASPQQPLSPGTVFLAYRTDHGWTSPADSEIPSHARALRSMAAKQRYFIDPTGWRHFGTARIESTLDTFHSIVKSPTEDLMRIVELAYLASYEYNMHQFDISLTLGWMVAERVLNERWKNYLRARNPAVTKINRDRRDKLTGRDYTASIKTEVLSLAGDISDDIRSWLDEARSDRNDLMHFLTGVNGDRAGKMLSKLPAFIESTFNIQLALHLSFSQWH